MSSVFIVNYWSQGSLEDLQICSCYQKWGCSEGFLDLLKWPHVDEQGLWPESSLIKEVYTTLCLILLATSKLWLSLFKCPSWSYFHSCWFSEASQWPSTSGKVCPTNLCIALITVRAFVSCLVLISCSFSPFMWNNLPALWGIKTSPNHPTSVSKEWVQAFCLLLRTAWGKLPPEAWEGRVLWAFWCETNMNWSLEEL